MNINFSEVLANLDPNALLRLISTARNDADYFYTTLLPERLRPDYNAQTGTMTIRATMAGTVGMDSPYPEGGVIDVGEFNEKIAKIAISIGLTEEVLRTIQQMVKEFALVPTAGGAPRPSDFLTGEALNFFDKIVLQALKDTREYLRGQALAGEIDWTFNKKRILVNYGFPAANLLAARTGNAAYGGPNSAFWTDVKQGNKLLKTSSRIVRIVHPDLADDIINNPANSLNVLNESNSSVEVQRVVGDNRVPTGDARERVVLIKYGLEGEVLDPSTSLSATKELPFHIRNKMLQVGSGNNRGYRVGEGSTPDPRNDLELGYTHLGPTVENNGTMGDWGRLYTPEARPWSLRGEGVSNCLPVLEGNKRVVVATSDVSN